MTTPSRRTETRHATPGNACTHFLNFGLTCDDYDRMRERARDSCEICETPEEATTRAQLVIDHFHGGGVWFVRGLVCDRCNSVMARHDRAAEWGPASLPWADKARQYHLNAFGQPTADELRRADQYIQSRTPFTTRGMKFPAPRAARGELPRLRVDRGPQAIANFLRRHLTQKQLDRVIELLSGDERTRPH